MAATPADRPATLTFACRCTGPEDGDILGVLTLTPAIVARLRACRADLLALRPARPGLISMSYDNTVVRVFHGDFNRDAAGVAALFRAAAAANPDELDGTWFPLDPAAVPAAGDYRTAYALLRVSETYLVVEGAGEHARDGFETAAIPDALLASFDPPSTAAAEPGP